MGEAGFARARDRNHTATRLGTDWHHRNQVAVSKSKIDLTVSLLNSLTFGRQRLFEVEVAPSLEPRSARASAISGDWLSLPYTENRVSA
jgi:hypothetical protein